MSVDPTPGDWTAALAGPFGEELRETLLALPLRDVQRLPPPRRGGGLPIGHELRILRRYLRGESSLLDPSGLSGLYRALAAPRTRLLHRGMIQGEPLAAPRWEDLLGRETVDRWRRHGALCERGAELWCPFRVIVLAEKIFVVDPLDVPFPGRIHIGQDSLNLVEHVGASSRPALGRYLDVGTGSGVVLLTTLRPGQQGVGLDINPRAVRAARFNAALNGIACEIREGDVFASDSAAFDLVTWNTPFVLIPEEGRQSHVDGYGGHLGIELTLRFFDRLPSLLREDGEAVLLSSAPVMDDGSNVLERELLERGPRAALDTTLVVLQTSWYPELFAFWRSHGVRRCESVILHISRGSGRLKRADPPLAQRLIDRVRERLFYLRYES